MSAEEELTKFIIDEETFQKKARQAVRPPLELVLALQCMLRADGIPFLVAPFEADPQVVHLARELRETHKYQNVLVYSEDSDMIPFGAEDWICELKSCGRGKNAT